MRMREAGDVGSDEDDDEEGIFGGVCDLMVTARVEGLYVRVVSGVGDGAERGHA